MVPEEGGIIWVTPMEIPAGAEHPADAHAFMDFVYRPEIAAMVTDWVLYMTPVPGRPGDDASSAPRRRRCPRDQDYYANLADEPARCSRPTTCSANLHSYKALSPEEERTCAEAFGEVVNG